MRRALRIFLVLGLVYLVAGYLTARIVPAPRLGVEGSDYSRLASAPPEASGVHTVRGVLSVHSGRSHDAEGTLEEVARAATRADLDFVVLGDHPQVWAEAPGALDPVWMEDRLLVPGVEMVVADRGRVLAVGLDQVPRRWENPLEDLLAHVDSTFGFVSVVHPRSPRNRERWKDQSPTGIHGWEAFDVSEMARMRLNEIWAPYHIVALFGGLPFGRTDEALVGLWRERSETPAILAYDTIRASQAITLTGALNHHPKARVPGGLFPPYAPFFRTVVNHVGLSEPLSTDPVVAREQLTSALREGSVHVSLGYPDRVAGFRFWAETEEGVTAGQGGALDPEGAASVVLRARVPDEAPGRVLVRFITDGRTTVWASAEAGETIARGAPPGIHRVEIHHAGTRVPLVGRFNLRPWILSNPIEIRPFAADSTPPADTP